MLKPHPYSLEKNLYIINKKIKKKSFTEAKNLCLTLLNKYPHNLRLKNILTSLSNNQDIEKDQNTIFTSKLINAFNSQQYDFVIEDGKKYLEGEHTDTNINNLVGASYLEKSNFKMAIHFCEKSVLSNPKNYFAYNNIGVAYSKMKKYQNAIQEFKKAININSNFIEAYLGLSDNYRFLNKYEEAVNILENAPKEISENFRIQKELAHHHSEISKDYKKAIEFFTKVIERDPKDAISLFNLHNLYYKTHEYNLSSKYLAKAYKLDSKNLQINLALAEIYLRNYYITDVGFNNIEISYNIEKNDKSLIFSALDKAKFHLDEINCIDPTFLNDNHTYIKYLFVDRQIDKAIKYQKIRIQNEQTTDAEDFATEISAYLFFLLHSDTFSEQFIFNEHKKFGQIFESQITPFKHKHKNIVDIHKTLKVGFVSMDFKEHPAKTPILTLWKNLKNFNIKICALNNEPLVGFTASGDFKKYIDEWYDIYDLKHKELSEFIYSNDIDILVDLSGHTNGNRLLTFAYKPSPIQISCIGYPGTTGLHSMDYILCDERIAPKYLYDGLYVEKMLRIPSAAAWAPLSISPKVRALPALKNKHITFGSLSYPRKITKRSIKLWSKVLLNNPSSILVQIAVDSRTIKEGLIKDFEENGVKEDQIRFIPKLKTLELLDYLNNEIDICLDNTMYTGGTTTNHTLWMGVPVITLRGKSRVQGQSASCLEHIGLNQFIAENEEEFVSIADHYSKDFKKLNKIRLGLRKRWKASKYRDPDLISNGFGTALRKIWQNYCKNEPVKPLDIKLNEINEY